MTRIESEIVPINHSQEKIFNFLNDFNNFQELMPSQVSNWTCTKESCSFTINGMAAVGMRIASSVPNEKVSIVSEGGKLPFAFTLDALIRPAGENSCTGQLIFEAEIPPFIAPMVEGPLRNFFNLLAKKMSEIK